MRRGALVIAGLLAVAAPAPARADGAAGAPVATAATAAQPAKKDARWAAKQHASKPLRQVDRAKLVGKAPAKLVSFYNQWTHEWLAVDAAARRVPDEVSDRFLRCHFTNEPTEMDGRLLGKVLDAARHFGVDRVHVVSGFRAPKYNLILRKKGREVARDSAHTKGHAVDFWLPGVGVQSLYDWAMKHQMGGVGFYKNSGFVHLDVGKKRTWNGD